VAALTALAGPADAGATADLEIELLLEALFQRFGFDLRGYARSVLRRKLFDLMRELKLQTVSGLQERVLHQHGAAAAVMRTLAVAPVAPFSAPEHVRQLRSVLVPSLRPSALPRIWLAECAGVGEAWTLAIVLAEAQLDTRTEIYATVSNEEMLSEIRDATLPADALPAYQADYERSGGTGQLADYLEQVDGRLSLLPHLKSRITWAQYSLVTDASFNEFQAIVCWRALPDFGPLLRQRVLRLFHESLARFGVLGIDHELSASDALAERYQQLVPGEPWYKRVG
jgi:chemotaxis protein methyltransferase CheR